MTEQIETTETSEMGETVVPGDPARRRLRTPELAARVGEHVLVAGWLQSRRELGGLSFFLLRDGWGTIQITTEGEAEALPFAGVGAESVIEVEGTVTAAPRAPGGIELRGASVRVISPVTTPLPVHLGKREVRAALPTLLDHGALTNRHPTRRAIFRLESAALAGFRETLLARDFTEIATPKLVAEATESGANVFAVPYFETSAYLAQSPQFYKQMMVGVYERVFEVGPVFRAEPHDSTRHLNEYVSLDAEMGFIADHHDVMALLRDVLAGMLAAMRERAAGELALLKVALPEVAERIPEIHFAEAQALIKRLHGVDRRGELDLSPEDERWLGEWAQAEYGSDFLYVTGYPTNKRAFYTAPDPANPFYSNSFDLIFRGVELVSGAQRLHRYEDYAATLEARGLPLAPFAAYIETMRYGMPPHGGFGLGLERLLMRLIEAPNIKLVTLFPRDLHRLTP